MKASIGDVALKAGVSNATVSRTFAHPEQVSEATRIKVQAAADALNFSISRSARILKSGRTYRVALLIGSHAIEWFTAEIIAGLNDVLRDAGYDLVIYPIEGAEARDAFFEELPVRNNADAVFVSSFGISPDEVKHLGTAKIPIVGVNTTSEGFDATVGIDDKEGIKLIVRHLAKLGHRNLLYLYESFSSTLGFSSYNRITGFSRSLRHHRWHECAHTGRAEERQHHRCRDLRNDGAGQSAHCPMLPPGFAGYPAVLPSSTKRAIHPIGYFRDRFR